MRSPQQKQRLVALVLGVALVVVFAAFVISGDVGDPSLGDGEVAVVQDAPDGTITEDELQAGLDHPVDGHQFDDHRLRDTDEVPLRDH